MKELVTKRCGHCGEHKPLSAFYKDASYVDGHATRCSLCARAAAKAYKTSDKGRERARAWSAANKDKARAYWQASKAKKAAAKAALKNLTNVTN
jgi:hypothetical protein